MILEQNTLDKIFIFCWLQWHSERNLHPSYENKKKNAKRKLYQFYSEKKMKILDYAND